MYMWTHAMCSEPRLQRSHAMQHGKHWQQHFRFVDIRFWINFWLVHAQKSLLVAEYWMTSTCSYVTSYMVTGHTLKTVSPPPRRCAMGPALCWTPWKQTGIRRSSPWAQEPLKTSHCADRVCYSWSLQCHHRPLIWMVGPRHEALWKLWNLSHGLPGRSSDIWQL